MPTCPRIPRPGDHVGVTGRVMFIRNTGKLVSRPCARATAPNCRRCCRSTGSARTRLEEWKRLVDLGDQVGVTGEVITSRRGELSVLADEWTMAAKSLRPLPVAHRPMSEETRVRQRYVDLIMRPQARDMVRTRAAVVRESARISFARARLSSRSRRRCCNWCTGARRPVRLSRTATLWIRICICGSRRNYFSSAAVVGGIERVFEINRNFRNEGIDSSHSPEFAMLEAYEAYGDYNTIADTHPGSRPGGGSGGGRLARRDPRRRH